MPSERLSIKTPFLCNEEKRHMGGREHRELEGGIAVGRSGVLFIPSSDYLEALCWRFSKTT